MFHWKIKKATGTHSASPERGKNEISWDHANHVETGWELGWESDGKPECRAGMLKPNPEVRARARARSWSQRPEMEPKPRARVRDGTRAGARIQPKLEPNGA